ncbi:MAG: methylated-DNA--[protein]-cysteine S-methyltransferase [Alphaproteobacteria bacterium]|nr:methylated-DNA--[protein]-cysteine S-methyltransferase [Alphaproteobacteria bacterium]
MVCDGDTLVALDFADCQARLGRLLTLRWPAHRLVPAQAPPEAAARLEAYLSGRLDAFAGLALDPGGSTFQRQVWAALRRIPPGGTMSYGELAAQLGRPAAARAVGHANGRNPIAIAIPCHRLIGGDGRLTGYAGGLERKAWLLRHEGALPAPA